MKHWLEMSVFLMPQTQTQVFFVAIGRSCAVSCFFFLFSFVFCWGATRDRARAMRRVSRFQPASSQVAHFVLTPHIRVFLWRGPWGLGWLGNLTRVVRVTAAVVMSA